VRRTGRRIAFAAGNAVRVEGAQNQPLASILFLRGQQLTPQLLTSRYGWDRAQVQDTAGRRLVLVGWNDQGNSVAVRQEYRGTEAELHKIALGLKPSTTSRIADLRRQPAVAGTHALPLLAPQ